VERLSGEHMGRVSSIRQVAIASFVGTALEWYDYFLYGTAAALIFNELFFPEADPLMGTLLAFATFGVGFGTRPIGGLVFGHFGDKIGRKGMLVITLMIMGLATFAIGLMPPTMPSAFGRPFCWSRCVSSRASASEESGAAPC
jgi:MFS transporter, MHS family, shikimate and dehydroshikimate transport protein